MTEIRRDLLFLLHDVARLVRVEVDKRARAHGMTRAQWAALVWLERCEGLSQKELAALLEVEPITVARLIDRLERRGVVERRADPNDRRVWRLHLRQAAYAVLRDMEPHRDELAAMVTDGLPPETQELMIRALLGMKARLIADTRPRSAAGETAPDQRVAEEETV